MAPWKEDKRRSGASRDNRDLEDSRKFNNSSVIDDFLDEFEEMSYRVLPNSLLHGNPLGQLTLPVIFSKGIFLYKQKYKPP